MAYQTLDQWITEAHSDTEDKDGELTMLSLVHVKGISEQEIHTTRLNTGKKWTVKELATLFQKKAEQYAEQLNGVQTFYLLAFYAGRTEPQARKPFRVNSSVDLVESGGSTEGPTGTGLTQQAMRHMEAVFQLSIRQQAQAFSAQEKALEMLSTTNYKLMKEVGDSQEIIMKLVLERADKTHEHRMEELRFSRGSEERHKLLGQIPPLVNTIMGREVFPLPTEDTSLMNLIAEEMDIDRINKLMTSGLFSPKLMALLAARMERYLNRENEKDTRIIQQNHGVDPEKEIVGEN
jgi:hypothetical protein